MFAIVDAGQLAGLEGTAWRTITHTTMTTTRMRGMVIRMATATGTGMTTAILTASADIIMGRWTPATGATPLA
ncbi:hypothetical protein D3C80_762850 [compost metagenome]